MKFDDNITSLSKTVDNRLFLAYFSRLFPYNTNYGDVSAKYVIHFSITKVKYLSIR